MVTYANFIRGLVTGPLSNTASVESSALLPSFTPAILGYINAGLTDLHVKRVLRMSSYDLTFVDGVDIYSLSGLDNLLSLLKLTDSNGDRTYIPGVSQGITVENGNDLVFAPGVIDTIKEVSADLAPVTGMTLHYQSRPDEVTEGDDISLPHSLVHALTMYVGSQYHFNIGNSESMVRGERYAASYQSYVDTSRQYNGVTVDDVIAATKFSNRGFV